MDCDKGGTRTSNVVLDARQMSRPRDWRKRSAWCGGLRADGRA